MINPQGVSSYNPADANINNKPINKYYHNSKESTVPLKYFKGQDLEMYYMEK